MRNPSDDSTGLRPDLKTMVFLAAIAFACAGCVHPEPVMLSLAPVPRAVVPPSDTAARVLEVEVLPVTEQNSGNVFGSRMIVSGLDARLVDALHGITGNDSCIDARLVDANVPRTVRVSFAKTYIHTVYQTKSAVVVLKLEHQGNTRYFRAQRTGLSWTGGDNEFRNALIKAFDEAVAKLRPELLKIAVPTA